MPYLPHVFTWDPPVTIVTAMYSNEDQEAVKYSMQSALLANPDAKLTVLVNKDADPQQWDPVYWAGRLTVMRIRVAEPPSRWPSVQLEDWAVASMQAEYLRRLATSSQQAKDEKGHIVLVRPHVMFYRGLRELFDKEFTIGVSMQPVAGNDLDLSVWFVRKEGVSQAAAVLEEVRASYQGSMAATMKSVMAWCFEGAGHVTGIISRGAPAPEAEAEDSEEGFEADVSTVLQWPSKLSTCKLKGGMDVSLLSLPCEIFNADRDTCPPDHKAKVASAMRARDESIMSKMWMALQRRNRVSMMKFFSFLKGH